MALAEERANYCRNYIIRRYEVSESRIHTEWYGARSLPLGARDGDWPSRRAAELIIELVIEE
jgi:outer membrane protein OmpA-like peptidoglycan-associated protein